MDFSKELKHQKPVYLCQHLILINILASEKQSTELATNDINQDNKSLMCDLGLRRQIWDYPVNERDEIR